MGEKTFNALTENFWFCKINKTDRAARHLIFVSRSNAAAGGADFSRALCLLARPVQLWVKR